MSDYDNWQALFEGIVREEASVGYYAGDSAEELDFIVPETVGCWRAMSYVDIEDLSPERAYALGVAETRARVEAEEDADA